MELIHNFKGLDIPKTEEKRNAKFIGCFPIQDRNQPVYCFYQKTKHPRGSHYFGLFFGQNFQNPEELSLWVCDAGEVETKTYSGFLRPDGKVLYSAFRHDYVTDEFGNMVDGGNDYFRYHISNGKIITFTFKDGELIECPSQKSQPQSETTSPSQ